jgi:hypothetical protein
MFRLCKGNSPGVSPDRGSLIEPESTRGSALLPEGPSTRLEGEGNERGRGKDTHALPAGFIESKNERGFQWIRAVTMGP